MERNIGMLKKSVFGLLATMLLLMSVAVLPALGYVEAGNKLGDLEFPAPLADSDATYLGVPAGKPFKLSQVAAPYVLVEVFATGCSHCFTHAPHMNTLYDLINKDTGTAGKVKVIGLASGDSIDNCTVWKKQCKVPFALAVDTDSKTTGKINIMGTPTTILLNKNGDVLLAKPGAFPDPEAFLKDLKAAMK
jgi:thiol-disulfide isomerase/thioredoxin